MIQAVFRLIWAVLHLMEQQAAFGKLYFASFGVRFRCFKEMMMMMMMMMADVMMINMTKHNTAVFRLMLQQATFERLYFALCNFAYCAIS